MATRLYKPSSGAAAVSPAFDAAWEQTTNADRVRLRSALSNTAFVDRAEAETSVSDSHDVLIRQYVSDPLDGAGTLTGTMKGQVLTIGGPSSPNMRTQVLVRIVSNDGSTVRGTALAHTTDDPAATPPYFQQSATRNRKIPKDGDVSLTSTAWQDGDRIVVEEGYRAHNTTGTSRTGTMRYGDNAGSDLPENETSSTDQNTWIEFSQTLAFQVVAPGPVLRRRPRTRLRR